MARQLRQRSGTGIYHVMLRGINRQDIFEDNEDFLRFMDCIRGLVLRYDEHGYPLPPLCTRQASRPTGISFGVIRKIRKQEYGKQK